jgi:hypothetical protein
MHYKAKITGMVESGQGNTGNGGHGNAPVSKCGAGDDGSVRDANAMMYLIFFLQT